MDPRTSAQDVMRCDLCETAVVLMQCDTCLVSLCKACVGEHISTNESKKHEIVPLKIRKSTTIYPECIHHVKERCEMYCNQCDIPVCISCVASDKHLGHKLLKILQVLDEERNKIKKDVTELNETIYPTYQDIAYDVQNRISHLKKEYGDLSTAITKHGEDWHREIDKIIKKLKAEVDEMKNTQLQTLQKHLEEINQKMSDIRDEIDSVEMAIETNNLPKLLNTTSIVIYRNLPQKVILSLPKFIPGKIQGDELSKMFGVLSSSSLLASYIHGYSMRTPQKSPEARSSPPVKQLLDEPQTLITLDTGYGALYNVACQSDEKIWTSGNDNTMKLYSINQGSLLKSITTKSGTIPWDLAVTKCGDLVYTDYSDRTVNIVENGKIDEVIRLQNWSPQCVCSTSSGDLMVAMYSDDDKQTKVVCYSGSKEKQTIQFDDKSNPLYFSGLGNKYITENRNLDICVSDEKAEAVVVVDQAGKLRFRYTGHTPALSQPFSPQGITTDSQSHILTADHYNHCVHIIDKDGQFLYYIDCGLSEPQGLYTDTNDNLFVAQNGKRQVMKIKYLK